MSEQLPQLIIKNVVTGTGITVTYEYSGELEHFHQDIPDAHPLVAVEFKIPLVLPIDNISIRTIHPAYVPTYIQFPYGGSGDCVFHLDQTLDLNYDPPEIIRPYGIMAFEPDERVLPHLSNMTSTKEEPEPYDDNERNEMLKRMLEEMSISGKAVVEDRIRSQMSNQISNLLQDYIKINTDKQLPEQTHKLKRKLDI